MTPERWQQVNEIYHDALEIDASQQATFLAQACAGDAELRDEVESLIASHDQAGSFISEPALKVAARILSKDQAMSRVGRSFSHYRLESLLGVGGMGEVYLAEDTKLDRHVAVKVLNEKFSQHESNLDRFIQEAKAASALNHPNILVIHEIGVSKEANYIVSEFIEGKTLRERISESPMQLPEVLEISIQIANALRAAHEAHLVHRDIKPENIMIRPDGYLKVLDFGLAKLIEKKTAIKQNTTAKAVILGTVNYMSPEQAKGEQVDERTDIFSLGVVIHEMIVGQTPFAGATISDTFANLINAEPQPLSDFAANLPDELQRITFKMLRKDRAQRYQTMDELLTDLKALKENLTFDEKLVRSASAGQHVKKQHQTPAVLVLVALLAGAIGLEYRFFSTRKTLSRPDGKTSVVVLPLKPINPKDHDQLYEIGIADSLILKLGSMGLRVRPLSVSRQYTDIKQDPLAAGREQQADFVLASNYELARGKIRVTAQLLNVANGQVEETYQSEEKDVANVFAMQDAIAGEVGNVLSARFPTTSRPRIAKRGTTNEDAYRLYLQGMYLFGKRTPPDAQKAVEVLEQAVRLDPNYARAWAGKAHVHLTIGSFGSGATMHDAYRKSVEAVNKALALDKNLADAHSALCETKMAYEYDFAGAGRECKRAVEADPNSSLAHLTYSRYLNGRGRFDEAISEVKTAIDLEPTSLFSQRSFGTSLYYARRYPEAITQFKRVIAVDKGFGTTYNWLVVALEMQGNYSEAYEWWMKMATLYKYPKEALQAYRAAYETSGWQGLLVERARRCDLESFKPDYKGVYFQGAVEHAKVGQKDKAFEYLKASFQRHEKWLSLLKVEPGLDSLRDDPRFDELVKRVGL